MSGSRVPGVGFEGFRLLGFGGFRLMMGIPPTFLGPLGVASILQVWRTSICLFMAFIMETAA